jgi:hypothetical protein
MGDRSFLRCFVLPVVLLLGLLLTGCDLPQVSAEERLFLDLSLDFLGAYDLPNESFQETRVGGLSALSYDRQRDRLYAVSDDRSNYAPARFYTLKLNLDTTTPGTIGLGSVAIESVTALQNPDGGAYSPGSLDPEGLALSPRQSVFVASEGVSSKDIAPFIDEFDLATGQWKARLPIPQRYVPATVEGKRQGMQDNLGFEALTLNPGGFSTSWLEPFRLFAATEAPIAQDIPSELAADTPSRSRFLHYLIGDELPTLLAEHLYLIDPPPPGALVNGLTELQTLDQAGHFLSLERSYGLNGASARIYQLATGGATDISGFSYLPDDLTGIVPIRKQLVLDLASLTMPLGNLEGMTLGPRLPDGTQSLVLVSDNDLNDTKATQFLLFRLNGWAVR